MTDTLQRKALMSADGSMTGDGEFTGSGRYIPRRDRIHNSLTMSKLK